MKQEFAAVSGILETEFNPRDALQRQAGFEIAVIDGGDEEDIRTGTIGFLGEHLEKIQVALAKSRVADGTDTAFEFVKDEDQLLAIQRCPELIDVRRLVGAEDGAQPLADDPPERFEREIGELARDDAGAGGRAEGEPILGKPRLAVGWRTAQMERNQKAMRFADTLRSLREEQTGLGLGGIQPFVDRLNEAANFSGGISRLEKVARA